MERIRGIILRRDCPEGVAATPSLVRAQQHAFVATLARLQGLDCRTPGLAELGRAAGYVARQVAGWTERYGRARTPDAASADAVTAWLAASEPAETRYPAVIHNDYKLDNVVFDAADPARLIGVLDWEMATVGDRLMDLGYSLAYWVQSDDSADLLATRMLPTHLPGSLNRSEVLESYASMSGQAFLLPLLSRRILRPALRRSGSARARPDRRGGGRNRGLNPRRAAVQPAFSAGDTSCLQ